MKTFKGRVIARGRAKAKALVSRNGFNTLASYQKSLMFGDKKGTCSDQNNPDLYKKEIALLKKRRAIFFTIYYY